MTGRNQIINYGILMNSIDIEGANSESHLRNIDGFDMTNDLRNIVLEHFQYLNDLRFGEIAKTSINRSSFFAHISQPSPVILILISSPNDSIRIGHEHLIKEFSLIGIEIVDELNVLGRNVFDFYEEVIVFGEGSDWFGEIVVFLVGGGEVGG